MDGIEHSVKFYGESVEIEAKVVFDNGKIGTVDDAEPAVFADPDEVGGELGFIEVLINLSCTVYWNLKFAGISAADYGNVHHRGLS